MATEQIVGERTVELLYRIRVPFILKINVGLSLSFPSFSQKLAQFSVRLIRVNQWFHVKAVYILSLKVTHRVSFSKFCFFKPRRGRPPSTEITLHACFRSSAASA